VVTTGESPVSEVGIARLSKATEEMATCIETHRVAPHILCVPFQDGAPKSLATGSSWTHTEYIGNT
jgi:hypothetical protein